MKSHDGFSLVESLLVVAAVIIIGGAGWAVYAGTHKGASLAHPFSSASNAESLSFPTGHLQYALPQHWKHTLIPDDGNGQNGLETTKQIKDYGYAEYAEEIDGPTTVTIPPSGICGIPCERPSYEVDFRIFVADFGTHGYTSSGKWYQSTLDHTFNDPGVSQELVNSGANYERSDTSDTIYKQADFGGKPSYCVGYTAGAKNSLSFPAALPPQLASGGCYTLWHNRVYFVVVYDSTAYLHTLPSAVTQDRQSAINILNSIRFN